MKIKKGWPVLTASAHANPACSAELNLSACAITFSPSSHKEEAWDSQGGVCPCSYRARLKRLPFCARRRVPPAVSCGPSLNTSPGLWELCENSQLKCEKLYLKFLHNKTTFIYFWINWIPLIKEPAKKLETTAKLS